MVVPRRPRTLGRWQSERYTYPFSAIVGQQRMKLALVLNAINPAIGGVLIRGEKGTAKSTAVRALARLLPEQEVVEGCRFGCSPEGDLCWEVWNGWSRVRCRGRDVGCGWWSCRSTPPRTGWWGPSTWRRRCRAMAGRGPVLFLYLVPVGLCSAAPPPGRWSPPPGPRRRVIGSSTTRIRRAVRGSGPAWRPFHTLPAQVPLGRAPRSGTPRPPPAPAAGVPEPVPRSTSRSPSHPGSAPRRSPG